MFRPALRPPPGMSIQKSYKLKYNKNLRAPLLTAAIVYDVKTWDTKYKILKQNT